MISITGDDFERERAAAERDLLGILDINEPNACRLTVMITTPAFVQNGYAGDTYPLSFCMHHDEGDGHF